MSYVGLIGEDRVKWVEQQYDKYTKRRRALVVLGLSGLILLFSTGFWFTPLLNDQPEYVHTAVSWTVLLTSTGMLIVAYLSLLNLGSLLPPTEDRVLHYLTPALLNLKAYVSNWNEESRKKTLENLEKISSLLGRWDTGNLRFVTETTGETVQEFKKNFRARVIPAVKKGDRATVTLLRLWLDTVRDIFEKSQLTELHLKSWNNYLSTASTQDLHQPQYPYLEPIGSRVNWVKSKWTHFMFIVAVPVAPAIVYSLAVDTQIASKDAAFGGAIAVLVAIIGAYVVYMTLGKKSS